MQSVRMPRRLGCSFKRLVTAGSPMLLLTLGYNATTSQAAKHALSGNSENVFLISLIFLQKFLVVQDLEW